MSAHVCFRPIADIARMCEPSPMKAAYVGLAIVLLAACSTAEERKQKSLMDQIEHTVRLPGGAHPLSAYARYYAFQNGGVHAVYIIPWDRTPLLDNACGERGSNSTSHEGNCQILLDPLKAGQRRWLGHSRDLPVEFEGGCKVVEIDFDVARGRVTNAACHLNA